jgi:hypothetical protein
MMAMASEQTTWDRFRSELQADVMAQLGEHISRLTWTRSQVEAAQRDGLRRLLAHAAEH